MPAEWRYGPAVSIGFLCGVAVFIVYSAIFPSNFASDAVACAFSAIIGAGAAALVANLRNARLRSAEARMRRMWRARSVVDERMSQRG